METLAGAPRYPRVWAKQASPWGSTWKGDSRLESVSTSAAESNGWSPAGGRQGNTLKEIGMGIAVLSNSVTPDSWTISQSPYQGGRM